MLGLFKEYNGGLILEHESVQSTMLTEKKKKKYYVILHGYRKKLLSASKFIHDKNLNKLEIEVNFLTVLKSNMNIFFPGAEIGTSANLLYHILWMVPASNKGSK